MTIVNKIDFAVVIGVNRANPNGDPLNGNRPRQTSDRYGEISDVAIKRKMRNRLLAMGEDIFVQSDDNRVDECRSLNDRFQAAGFTDGADIRKSVCERWFDVRAFGQVFAFKSKDATKKSGRRKSKGSEYDEALDNGAAGESAGAVSIGIRGPVTIQSAYSLTPILPESVQITKSVNLETNMANPDKKDSDTMGMKHRVVSAIYVAYGAITPQLASKTGFSDTDAEKIKWALRSLFEGDASSARPEGSMEVLHVVWCKHSSSCGQYSSAHVHRVIADALSKRKDGTYSEEEIKGALKNMAIDFLPALEGEELERLPKRTNK
ncbi:MAG: CRISPR-associated protein [Kiritimatiellia bacterium]